MFIILFGKLFVFMSMSCPIEDWFSLITESASAYSSWDGLENILFTWFFITVDFCPPWLIIFKSSLLLVLDFPSLNAWLFDFPKNIYIN